MIADKSVFNYKKEYKIKNGDFLVTKDGYVFMIVQENIGREYRLLRLIDGESQLRTSSIENVILRGSYNSIEEMLEQDNRKSYKVIPSEKFMLSMVE